MKQETEKISELNKALQIKHHESVEVPDPPRIKKVVNLLKDITPGKMVDVGYSKGSFADYFLELGWEVTALDINRHQRSDMTMIQCDVTQGFPIESESYSVVTAGEIIEHMLDEGALLDECYRVLRKEGILVLTTPNLAFLVNRFLVFIGRMPMFVYAPYHYHFHTKRTLTELVEQHGFKTEKVLSSHILYSSRRHPSGIIFEWLGNIFPTLGAHLIILARKV